MALNVFSAVEGAEDEELVSLGKQNQVFDEEDLEPNVAGWRRGRGRWEIIYQVEVLTYWVYQKIQHVGLRAVEEEGVKGPEVEEELTTKLKYINYRLVSTINDTTEFMTSREIDRQISEIKLGLSVNDEGASEAGNGDTCCNVWLTM
ncbi:hypothetical protein J6590_064052 [Homalodisca vitripennis]|nr:hypothetical protein J6590_064052 [Homalodisca vitripennis]